VQSGQALLVDSPLAATLSLVVELDQDDPGRKMRAERGGLAELANRNGCFDCCAGDNLAGRDT